MSDSAQVAPVVNSTETNTSAPANQLPATAVKKNTKTKQAKRLSVKPKVAAKKSAAKQPVKKEKNPKAAAAASASVPTHPKFLDMTREALKALNERNGSSRQAILKYIINFYNLDSKLANSRLKLALKTGVKNGNLKQLSGVGASGSFKVATTSDATSKRKSVTKSAPVQEKKSLPAPKKAAKKSAKSSKAKPVDKKKDESKPKRNVQRVVKPSLTKAPAPEPVAKEEKPKKKKSLQNQLPKPNYHHQRQKHVKRHQLENK